MDSIPQELVVHISSYLDYNDLKSTLLLSRRFQYAAEQSSEAFVDYTLTLENASKFVSIYSGRRAHYLQEVRFVTTISARDDHAEGDCRDSAADLRDIDEQFTHQIRTLFKVLKAVHEQSGASLRIHLTIYEPTQAIDGELDCYHQMFVSWRVHLLSPSALSSLDCVHTLTIKSPERQLYDNGPDVALRKLDLRIVLDIAKKFRNLKLLRCKLGGDEWRKDFAHSALKAITREWIGPRRDSRHDFGKGLEGIKDALPLLQHVHLDFLYPFNWVECIDQRSALPNLTSPAPYDPFSSSLRLLSYQLRTMSLRVVADKTLFWPLDGAIPVWPNLETLSVLFHMSTPSGSWYFYGLPGAGATQGYELTSDRSYPPLAPTSQDYEDDDIAGEQGWSWLHDRVDVRFRTCPNGEITPFLSSFAKAAASMPSLKEFILWSALSIQSPPTSDAYEDFDTAQVTKFPNEELAWGIAYAKPGVQAFTNHPGENNADRRQIWWRVAKWRPDAELHTLFKDIGVGSYGNKLLEYWGDDYAGQGLDRRDLFESWERARWAVDPE